MAFQQPVSRFAVCDAARGLGGVLRFDALGPAFTATASSGWGHGRNLQTTGSRKQEAGKQEAEAGSRKQEAGNRKQGMNETVENPEGPVASAPGPHSFPVSCFLSPASCLLFSRWLRPRLVSLVELRVPVVKLLTLALHEHFLNAGPNVDWITRRHDHVGDLADLDRTVVLVDPEHARRVDRDRLQRLFRIEAIGHGQADLVRQVAGATRSASCPRNLHAGLLEHARIREHQVIRIIVPRHAGDTVENDRDAARGERVSKLPAFARAVNDDLHLHAVHELDHVPHLGDGVGVDDDRHLTTHCRDHGFIPQVPVETGRRLGIVRGELVVHLTVRLRLGEPAVDLTDVVLVRDHRVDAGAATTATEPTAAPSTAPAATTAARVRPRELLRDLLLCDHLLVGVAGEVDETGEAGKYRTTADREHLRDAVGPRDTDVVGADVSRRGVNVLRVEVADFARIDRTGNTTHLDQAHVGAGVDESRVDEHARRVDLGRSRRRLCIRTNRSDAAVLDDDRAVRNLRTGDGNDGAASDHERSLRLTQRRRNQQSQYGQHAVACGLWLVASHRAPPSSDVTFGRFLISCISHSSVGAVERSKNTRPSIIVISTRDAGANGCPLKIAMSASLPTSIEPVCLSMPSCTAALSVIMRSAASSDAPPNRIALAASWYRRRARSSESELIVVTTPRSAISAALCGMASHASSL